MSRRSPTATPRWCSCGPRPSRATGSGDAYFPVAVETFLGRERRHAGRPRRRAIRRRRRPTSPDAAATGTSISPATRCGRAATSSAGSSRSRPGSRRRCTPTSPTRTAKRRSSTGCTTSSTTGTTPRGRLGDAPDHVRRPDRGGGAADVADRGRVLAAHRRRAQRLDRRLPPARRRSSGRVPGRRVARAVLLATALARLQRRDRHRLRRHAHAVDAVRAGRRPAAADGAGTGKFAWLSFAGLWGERVRGPYSGPTGPAEKRQWDEPVGWTDGWRNGSLAVPEGRSFGTTSTDVFCSGIAAGSVALLRLLYDPWTTLIVLGCLVLLAVWLARRTQWSPLTPEPIDRTRPAGVMLRDAWRIYLRNRRLLLDDRRHLDPARHPRHPVGRAAAAGRPGSGRCSSRRAAGRRSSPASRSCCCRAVS